MRKLSRIVAAIAAVSCAAAAAAPMTRDEYKAGRQRVAAEYQAEREKCGVRHGNALDLCVARAHGSRNVARAELEAAYKPGPKTQSEAALARAQAAYGIAKEECDERKGDERKVCVRGAKAELDRARKAARP